MRTKIRLNYQPSMTKFAVEKIHTLRGHRDCVYTLARAAESHQFYSAGGDGMVVQWNLHNPEQGRVIAKVPTSIYALHRDATRNRLIVGQNYEGIHIIDLETRAEKGSLQLGKAALFDIRLHGQHLLIATAEGELIVVDYDTLNIVKNIKPTTQRARSIAINTATDELAVGFSDHTIRIYDATDYRLKYTLAEHDNSVFTVQYTPDSRYLVSGSRDARLKFWDVRENYQLTESIVAHMYAINHVDFSLDRQYFATGSMDKAVKVWDADQRRLLKVIDKARHAGHGTSVNRVLWLPNESESNAYTLVSASDDRTISVWSLQ